MSTRPPRWLAVVLAVALVIAGAAAASAAPRAGAAERARLATLDREYRALASPARECGPPDAARRAAAALRARALRGAARAGVRELRARVALARRAAGLLRRATRGCAAQVAEPPPEVLTPPAPLPPAPPLPPGVGPGGPAVLALTLADLVNGAVLDLTPVLGDSQLPPQIGAVGLDRLDDRACRGIAVICVGLDRPLLNDELRELMNRNGVELALRNLGSLNLAGVLTQLDAAFAGGDPAALISIQRLDDRSLQLTPVGAIAELRGLSNVPAVVVGRLQAVGVLRCPPAEAGGLPVVCVA